jgi:hydrogenase maturation protease
MREVIVLGLGNVLLGDDGVGVLAVNALLRDHQAPPGVRILDGGTLGLALLELLDADAGLVLVDAVADDAPAGTLVRHEGEAIGEAVASLLSPHQFGVADLLGAARLLSRYPERVVLLGVVPEAIKLGIGLTPPVAEALPALVRAVTSELARLGYPLVSREVVDDAPPEQSRVDVARALGL